MRKIVIKVNVITQIGVNHRLFRRREWRIWTERWTSPPPTPPPSPPSSKWTNSTERWRRRRGGCCWNCFRPCGSARRACAPGDPDSDPVWARSCAARPTLFRVSCPTLCGRSAANISPYVR